MSTNTFKITAISFGGLALQYTIKPNTKMELHNIRQLDIEGVEYASFATIKALPNVGLSVFVGGCDDEFQHGIIVINYNDGGDKTYIRLIEVDDVD